MFQHIQFRRIEKFVKNYFDAGKVTLEQNQNDKLLQEISYFDGTIFRGAMDIEEETNIAYKEGNGKMIRGCTNSYYTVLKGTWSRGLFHGKKNTIQMNLSVFPKGYLFDYPQA